MTLKKFTFKNQKGATGLSAVGNSEPDADIKHEGKKVGWITPTSYHQDHCRAFFWVKQTPSESDPCDFKVVQLSHKTKTMKEMKEWLKEKTESIIAVFDLYSKD